MSHKRKHKKMSKRQKEFLSVCTGHPTGAEVVDGDLNFAIRQWKKRLKESGKLDEVYRRREFQKPSTKRRKEIEDAIYREKKSGENSQ